MGNTFIFFCAYVYLFLHWILEREELTYLDILLPAVIVVFIIAAGVVLLTQQFRKNLYRQLLRQEELKNQQQLDLMRAGIQAQEQERRRIARDMHDELGATLSITRMHLLQVEKKYGGQNDGLMAELLNIRGLTETSLENMRQLSHRLMPPQLESFGLVKTLEALAQQLNRSGQVKLRLQCPENIPTLDWTVSLTLYRIISELINNTLKHAAADTINIEILIHGDSMQVNYSDNGRGLPEHPNFKGLGLRSVEGRVKSVGGVFTLAKGPQPGFAATIMLSLAL